jgi:BirA family transcriptional regulator, biotin operon repressor / biotin---[acetyl-CoA-carboxylase] ligase
VSRVSADLSGAREAIGALGGRLGSPLSIEAETESTNDDAKHGAKGGAPHGATWLAETQTRGRGRQGRVWTSPRGENLLFSVLLRLSCPPQRVPPIALVAGLAVRDAVARALGDDAGVLVKWPNDVLVRSPRDRKLRKVAGVLVESALSGSKVESVVVGIGINVHTRELPEEIAELATSIARERDTRLGLGDPPSRVAILADVLATLDHDVEHVAHKGLGLVHGRLARHDALAGQAVVVEGVDLRGTACGIDPEGRLLLRDEEGVVHHVSSGEVKVRAASG